MVTQDKIYLSPSEARFMKLPPINQLVDKLPPRVFKFVVRETMAGVDYSLEYATSFKEPAKLYGDVTKQVNRIIHSYKQQDKNLGVLLHGVFGTGKSTLAKCIANTALESLELPVIIVTAQSIQHLEYLITNLKQPVMFLVDEFEKMFENIENQNYLLTLLDGLYISNHLFVFTANDASRINTYFFNRPSRIRYAIEYKSLGLDVCKEILEENFEPEYVEELLGKLATVNNLSFDVLQEVMTEAKHFPNTSAGELFNGFNLSRLNLNLSHAPITVKVGNEKLEDILTSVVKKYAKKNQVLSVRSIMDSCVTLDSIYSREFDEEDNVLFSTRFTILDQNDCIYFSPIKTTVSSITANTLELTAHLDPKYAYYFIDKLYYLLINSNTDSDDEKRANLNTLKRSLRTDLSKVDFTTLTLSIPRYYCTQDF